MIEVSVQPCPTCGDKSNTFAEGSWWAIALCQVCATVRYFKREGDALVLTRTSELSPRDRNAFQRVRRAHGEKLPS